MGLNTKQNLKQAVIGQNVPIRLPWFFITNGAQNPQSFSPTLERVQRLLSPANELLFSVRLSEKWALTLTTTIWLSVNVQAPEDTIYYARYVTPVVPQVLDPLRDFLIGVTLLETTPAISQVNDIPAGAQVSGEILVDQAP
jgi:hypothetical protein